MHASRTLQHMSISNMLYICRSISDYTSCMIRLSHITGGWNESAYIRSTTTHVHQQYDEFEPFISALWCSWAILWSLLWCGQTSRLPRLSAFGAYLHTHTHTQTRTHTHTHTHTHMHTHTCTHACTHMRARTHPPIMGSSTSSAMRVCIRCLRTFINTCIHEYVCMSNTMTHIYHKYEAFKPSCDAFKHVVSHVYLHPVPVYIHNYVRIWMCMYHQYYHTCISATWRVQAPQSCGQACCQPCVYASGAYRCKCNTHM